MNRVVTWDEWRARRVPGPSGARLAEALSVSRRTTGRRRSEADTAIILRMAHVEIERRESEGRLVRVGPRRYRLSVRR